MIYGYTFNDGKINAVTFDDLSLNQKIHIMVSRGKNKADSLKNTRKLFLKFLIDSVEKGYNCYFITFTFKKEFNYNNYMLWDRKQFQNYLRRDSVGSGCNFMLYCDFGDINSRFHLHGICCTRLNLDIKKDYFNKFGFTKLQLMNNLNVDYIVKYSVKFHNNVKFRVLKVNSIK